MRTTILGNVNQIDPEVITGDDQEVQLSKLGQIFTADWKKRLLLAGKLWRVSVGTFADAADVVYLTGGGAGTTMDLDQPEVIIGVDAGYYLIPVEMRAVVLPALLAATVTDGNQEGILAIGDRSAAPPTSVTGTVETPTNLLDGAGAFPGRAFSVITADITDPTVDEILAFAETRYSVGSAVGTNPLSIPLVYEPDVPTILAGPCSVAVYWGGGLACSGLFTGIFAAVPTSWFPVS